MLKREESQKLFEIAKTHFPGGVNSPVRAFKAVGGTPLFIDQGKGSHIWDADGNEFIDYCCSWGPLILGHAHPGVVQKVKETAEKGLSFGAPTRLENELADLIIKNHPHIEKMRFVSSGTEACMSAIRLARGYTGRDKIIKFEGCYHGHSDSLLVNAGSGLATFGISSSAGVPEAFAKETIVLPLNDIEAVKHAFNHHKHDIAAIIIEPIPANNGLLLQKREFLEFLADICSVDGSLLIFDEVISGFRIGFSGASGYYNVSPDIVTFGKIIGGGLPVGAYASSAKIMQSISPDGNVYQAGTLSGNPVAMAAGIAQLTECLQPWFYEELERKTKKLVKGVMEGVELNVPFRMYHIGSIFWCVFSDNDTIRAAKDIDSISMLKFKKFHLALLEMGIYLGPSEYEVGFVSAAHTDEDITKTIKAIREAREIAMAD
ncbi:MAG TPA: glutamate-1-semialdehyde 2,1-aminomutase [Bacteroidia bacterium]|nr:glutamate-1-semialdehyde 2,1-aminomutase [Bacteroidia bacterium]